MNREIMYNCLIASKLGIIYSNETNHSMVVCFSSAIFSCASSGIKAQELNLSSINFFFFFAGQIQPEKKQRN